jgi:hypothetical protein
MRRAALTLGWLCAVVASAAPTRPTVRAFYLGNSLTFMGPQWAMLKQLAVADPDGPTVETDFHVVAACSLEKHWSMGQAQEKMRKGKWDFVVLQGFTVGKGAGGVTEPVAVYEKWIEFVKSLGARPVLYHTTVGQMEKISSAQDAAARRRKLESEERFLVQLARKHGAWVVPAARAHWLARAADPQVLELRWPMFPPGDCHANALGHSLIACTFYPVLTGRQVVGLPWREVGLPSLNTGGGPNPDAPVLTETESTWLQSVAWAALGSFQEERGVGEGCKLPAAPSAGALLDVSKPEPVPDVERAARNQQRRFEFLRKYWACVQTSGKQKKPPTTKLQAGWMPFALEALAKDYPDTALPADIIAIKQAFEALPER